MNLRFKGTYALLLPVILLGIGGCAQNGASNSTHSGNLLKGLASSFLAARAFDRVLSGVKSDNDGKSKAAGEDLLLAAKSSGNYDFVKLSVQTLAQRGGSYLQAIQDSDDSEQDEFLQDGKQNYRAALSLLPSDYQKITELNLDWVTLNSIGYFLADWGHSKEDFQLAEFLTSASIAQQEDEIKLLPKNSSNLAGLLFSQAVFGGDSKAWALYKQGRYAQARSEQEQVLATEKKYGQEIGQPASAEVRFHLAEIYLALDERKLAQDTYEEALVLSPDAALQSKIEARLTTLQNSISM